jgi:hypothetical protein
MNNSYFLSFLKLAIFLSFGILVSGCDFTEVQVIKSQQNGSATVQDIVGCNKPIFVKEIKVESEYWEGYKYFFRDGIKRYVYDNKCIKEVILDEKREMPLDTLVLISKITEVDSGNPILRFMVGFGAGKANVKGEFMVQDMNRNVLLSFSMDSSHLGRDWLGKLSFKNTEQLVSELGEKVAEVIEKWCKGKKIETEKVPSPGSQMNYI